MQPVNSPDFKFLLIIHIQTTERDGVTKNHNKMK